MLTCLVNQGLSGTVGDLVKIDLFAIQFMLRCFGQTKYEICVERFYLPIIGYFIQHVHYHWRGKTGGKKAQAITEFTTRFQYNGVLCNLVCKTIMFPSLILLTPA